MQASKLTTAMLICGALGACSTATASAETAPAPEIPTAAQTALLTPDQIDLLTSGAPIDVVMDPVTGDVLSVVAAEVGLTPEISNRSVCDSGDGCYDTNKTPYADEGFYGSAGTSYGSWAYRSGYSSGNYTVYACWSGGCGLTLAPKSQLAFASDVTGTSFTIV